MSELKDWICYRDPNGVGFTHSWLSIGGGPYCCTRCGRQMPVETAPIPCPSWPVPQIPGPDYPALVTRLAQALGGAVDRLSALICWQGANGWRCECGAGPQPGTPFSLHVVERSALEHRDGCPVGVARAVLAEVEAAQKGDRT